MIVTCPGCASKYRVRNESVPPEGSKMKCPKCGKMFLAKPPSEPQASDAPPAGTVSPPMVARAASPLGFPRAPTNPPPATPLSSFSSSPSFSSPSTLPPTVTGKPTAMVPLSSLDLSLFQGMSATAAPPALSTPAALHVAPPEAEPPQPTPKPPPGPLQIAISWVAFGASCGFFVLALLWMAWGKETIALDGVFLPLAEAFGAESPRQLPEAELGEIDLWKTAAQEAEQRGDAMEALRLWRMIKDKDPDDRRAKESIPRVVAILGEPQM